MRTGKTLKRIAAAILCAVLLMALTAPSLAFAQERKTVRVGWHEPPYFVMDQYGRGSGYSYEYQRKLAAYTGWEYEYVKGIWSELLQMLIDGEIDLMSDVSYTEERAESILYASLPMGTDTYYILVAPDNTEITADYDSLNGKRVGAAKGSFQSGLFRQWAEEHGIQAELVELTSTEEESLQLLGTELDALATLDVYAAPATAVPVWKIGSSDFYFAVSKNRSDLLPELNAAMNHIQEESEYYNQQLHETYLTNDEVKHFLSTAEQEWLSDHGPIRVGYQDDYMAFCDADENGELSGALKDYLAEAADRLVVPLKFEPVAYPTKAAMMEGLARGEVDCVFPANLTDADAEALDAVITPPAMTTEVFAVVRESDQQSFVVKQDIRAAVNQNASISDMFLADHFPRMEITYYPDTPPRVPAGGGEWAGGLSDDQQLPLQQHPRALRTAAPDHGPGG